MKKIVLIFPNFGCGGMENQTAQIVDRLSNSFRFYIVSIMDDLSCKERILNQENVKFISLGQHRRHFQIDSIVLVPLLKKINPDVVVTFNWGAIEGIISAKLCGIKKIIHLERGFSRKNDVFKRAARHKWARRALLTLPSKVVVVSSYSECIARDEWWVPLKKIIKINNGVNVKRFYPAGNAKEKPEKGFSESSIIIGTVANLTPIKNHEYLVEVMEQVLGEHPKARLVIYGDGPEKDKLTGMVKAKNLEKVILFPGETTNPEDVYRTFDIFILASISEQMPNCILEAMASGLPIVSTDVGEISQMVSDSNKKFLYSLKEKEKMIKGLNELIQNAQLREDLGRANRIKVENKFPLVETIQAYERLFTED